MRYRNVRRSKFGQFVTVGLLGLLWAGCDDSPVGPYTPPPGLTECGASNRFRRSAFTTHSAELTNRWMPLAPGQQFILDGQANRGGGLLPHRVVFTVTDLTKVINGVESRVIWDRDYNQGELQEAELAFFAQDE